MANNSPSELWGTNLKYTADSMGSQGMQVGVIPHLKTDQKTSVYLAMKGLHLKRFLKRFQTPARN